MRKGIIYMAVGPTGKVYIGKTLRTLKYRKDEHFRNAVNPKNRCYNTKFYRAIRKYKNDFKWHIEMCVKESELINAEILTIKKYNSFKCGYNSTIGGDGVGGKPLGDKTKKILSKKFSGSNNPFYGKKHTEETKRMLSCAATGRRNG